MKAGGGGVLEVEGHWRWRRLPVLEEAWRDTTPVARVEALTGCHWRLVPPKAMEAGRTGRHSGPARRGLTTCTLLYSASPPVLHCAVLYSGLTQPHCSSLHCPALTCTFLEFNWLQRQGLYSLSL